MISYGSDLDSEYDDDGDIELEAERHDPERRARIREHGQQLLQALDPSRIRFLLGR